MYTETFCGDIINALRNAATCSVPMVKHNFYKHWWDTELTEAKNRSMQSHNMWTVNGKPKIGPLFTEMMKNKKEYELLIRIKEKSAKEQFTNELNEALLVKDKTSFWKIWKSKLGKKKEITSDRRFMRSSGNCK